MSFQYHEKYYSSILHYPMTPFSFLRRDRPLLLIAPLTCTFTDDFSYSMIHSVCAKHDNGVDCYECEIQTHVNALWSIFMQHLLPCNNPKSTRTFLEYKGIPVLKWAGYSRQT